MEYAGFGGFVLLVLNIWAIVSVIGSRSPTGREVLWILLIIVLPLVGFIVWFFAGPRAASATA